MSHHHRRNSTLSRESSSSSSSSSHTSINRKHSPEPSRTSRSNRYPTRDQEARHRNDTKVGSGTKDDISVGKRIYKTVEKLENPVKKLGKLVLWGAPLVLAGLEVRHEWHHHAHKRRMMDKEYEKAHLEIQLQMGKEGKKEGILIEGGKSHGLSATKGKEKDEVSEPRQDEVHILPYPAKVYYPLDRASQYPPRGNVETCQAYLIPHVPEAPCLDVHEGRRSGRRVKRPGSRDVLFPRVRSTSESVYEYRRW